MNYTNSEMNNTTSETLIRNIIRIAAAVVACAVMTGAAALPVSAASKAKPVRPAQVKSLKAATVTGTKVKVQWKKAKNATKYVVVVKYGKESKKYTTKKCSFTVKGLSESSTYKVYVKAYRGKKTGKASRTITVTTKDKAPVITDQSEETVYFGSDNKATLFVNAEGKNLKYAWYDYYPGDFDEDEEDDEDEEGDEDEDEEDEDDEASGTGVLCTRPRFIVKYSTAYKSDLFRYYCVVSNNGGAVASRVITVVKIKEPELKIVKQPYLGDCDPDELFKGDWYSINIDVENAESYQWYFQEKDRSSEEDDEGDDWEEDEEDDDDDEEDKEDEVPYSDLDPDEAIKLSGEKYSRIVAKATLSDNGVYFCVVRRGNKEIISDGIRVKVHGPVEITSEPEDRKIYTNKTVIFQIGASDAVEYIWQIAPYNNKTQWTTLDPETYGRKNKIYLSKCPASMDGSYIRCIAYGLRGTKDTSKTVRLYVGAKPAVTTPKTSYAVKKKSSCTISVKAAGTANTMTYQWYKNGKKIAGAAKASYKIKSVTAKTKYYCIVTNPFGNTKSKTITVSVK